MRQSIKKRIEKFEQQTTKLPAGMFVSPTIPDLAWPSKKDFELWEEEVDKAIGTPNNYNQDDMERHFKKAALIQQRCIRIKPARPIPPCLQEMINFNSQKETE